MLFVAAIAGSAGEEYVPTAENLAAREQFAADRFGIFIHWGLYSMFGHGEWYQYKEDIDFREYAKGAGAFYPAKFNADKWVRFLKNCGARYITITSRHHEGFSMWDTAESDFKITNTPFGRDVLKELSEACAREGMKLGFYYSHLDWHREDYPIGGHGKLLGRTPKPDWASYYSFMNNQLTELLTNYGRVNCIWFDGMWEHNADSVPFDWQVEAQYRLIHELQPQCLVINNHHEEVIAGEDVQTWERDLPGENRNGHAGMKMGLLPLETATTMCDHDNWGYDLSEFSKFRSSKELIQLLVRTAARDANLLLNIGPRPDGEIPEEAMDRLEQMGQWLQKNGVTIYGTRGGYLGDGENYVSTIKDNHIYVHFLKELSGKLVLEVGDKVKMISRLEDGGAIPFRQKKGKVTIEVGVPGDVVDYIVDIQIEPKNTGAKR